MSTASKPKHSGTLTVEQELNLTTDKVLQQANDHYRAGQLETAKELYHAILDVQPEHPDANHNLGILVVQSQQPSDGLPLLQRALEAQPECEQYWLSYVEALIQDGQLDVASQTLELGRQHGLQGAEVEGLSERLCVRQQEPQTKSVLERPVGPCAVQSSPGAQNVKNNRAPSRQEIKKLTSLRRKGRPAAIEKFARDLIVRFPNHGLGWKALGTILHKQGKIKEALPNLQKASELLPEDSEVHHDLAVMLHATACFAAAEEHFEKALKLKPDSVAAHSNLGNLLRVLGRLDEAEKSFCRALEIDPSAVIYSNLGTNFMDKGLLLEAEKSFRRALELSPDFALGHTNLGVSLRAQGRLEDAIASQRRALALDPDSTEQHSNLLFTLNYASRTADLSPLAEALKYGRMVQKRVSQPFSCWKGSAQPKRLRVGLVSGDLYNHPVGFFLESILSHLDQERIELIAYPTNSKADDLTVRIKPFFSDWKPLFGLNDESAARVIHEDGIHLLLDLSGHTSHNRLPMFVWKPAPVQASWLGYFATTGVAEIDFFVADKTGVPETQQNNFSESIWYLPDTRLCFSAPAVELSVAPLPALTNKQVTFGCFQKLTKIGDEVLKTWSSIFEALPEARLRWQCGQFDDPAVAERLIKRLHQFGIDSSRISLKGTMKRVDYLMAHAEVDLILDSFPFPGGTTTCEALWMGVPTLTLAGDTLLSRQGASLLTAAGLESWVVDSKEEYIEKAIVLSSDLDRLSVLRAGLREQVLNSPVFNAQRFARNFEMALWGMWQEKQPAEDLLGATGENEIKENIMAQEKPVMNFFNPVFWGTKDPERFASLMRQAADLTTAYHFGDNMFLFQRNNSMLNDQAFMKSWKENAITPPDQTIIWRRFILAMAAFHCQHLEGDFVECGAYQGVGAKTVIDYLGGKEFKKTFWLYDMFEHNENMVNHAMQAHGPQLHAQVVKRFKDYPNVKIFKGFLPDILKQGSPDRIAYLHLDLNQAPAEIATLDALFDRVVPGGMIILDDYEMVFYREQKLAEDDWFGQRGYKVFPLPTSQGFVIKR